MESVCGGIVTANRKLRVPVCRRDHGSLVASFLRLASNRPRRSESAHQTLWNKDPPLPLHAEDLPGASESGQGLPLSACGVWPSTIFSSPRPVELSPNTEGRPCTLLLQPRAASCRLCPQLSEMALATKVALTNVRVFDGTKVCDPSTVVIDGAFIGNDATGAREVDMHAHIL